MDWILSQARYFNNIPILVPDYRSVVHLEDEEDKVFWDTVLQRGRPGHYFYVSYSKSEKGNDTKGCDQCLKYKQYLSERFFICIDSDLRYLLSNSSLPVTPFIIQTYTYSWESHYCDAASLQSSVEANSTGFGFDFSIFLTNLSHALYQPLLLLLFCKRNEISYLKENEFRQIIKNQCSWKESQNNGQGYVAYLQSRFTPLITGADSIGFDPAEESARYASMGLNLDNAYLHVRGHNIYDLVSYIGRMYSKHARMSFDEEILGKVSVGGEYWEYTRIIDDLQMF